MDRAVAPGEMMWARRTKNAVVGCVDAAAARSVPLANELKSLVLETSAGFVVAHLCGDRRLDLRKVKRTLDVRQARLASRDQLRALGLEPGTVSAVLEPVWGMRHVVSSSVLALSIVTTNDGTLTGFLSFDPKVLLKATWRDVSDIDAEPIH